MRNALAAFATVALVGGVAALSVDAVSSYLQYSEWGTLARTGSPPRIGWCGRRYYPGSRPLTGGEFAALPAPRPWVKVLTTPSGEPVLATPSTGADKSEHHTNVCAMLLAVKEGSDRYLIYPLSGGP